MFSWVKVSAALWITFKILCEYGPSWLALYCSVGSWWKTEKSLTNNKYMWLFWVLSVVLWCVSVSSRSFQVSRSTAAVHLLQYWTEVMLRYFYFTFPFDCMSYVYFTFLWRKRTTSIRQFYLTTLQTNTVNWPNVLNSHSYRLIEWLPTRLTGRMSSPEVFELLSVPAN